ncbi:MAG: methyltransferase domain-containing protein [Proteobacteria bacterium]|nr:methyltransferase domain-containing protein [Pseudomonadota bacterium]MBU4383100.1 methyltransferase domain-containing protein [Pseudomonadota bacterium]MBU4604170.1 methyltransferase domain-containing protein [Pseudomonadota bacterium]MCG2762796.1 acetylserotonin O-methyltransferase [Desulfarculaceae bacterium]
MSPKQWKPEDVSRLAHGFWASATLHAAVSTGLAARLAKKGPATAEELASELGLDPRATRILVIALHALELAVKRGEAYSLAPGLETLLDPDAPRSLNNMALHMADLMPVWAHLADSVRSGKPVERPEKTEDNGEPAGRAHFYRAMRDIARQQATGTAARLGLASGQSLLDLAGGPGVYGLTFADETPGLSATVFDLPGAQPYFQEEAARHARGAEVRFIAGDYQKNDLGGPYDVVWLSQVLHGEGPEECRKLIAKAASVLKSGGALWVQEFVVDTENPKHPWPALFSLNMLVNTTDGQGYTAADICGFMRDARFIGCVFDGPTREGSPAALVRGFKP